MTTIAPSAKTARTATAETTERRRTQLSAPASAVLSAFRIVVGFLFLCHGLVGFGLLGGVDGNGTAVPLGQWPGWWATVIETVGALFILAGLFTRQAAVLLSGTMAYAYFTVHAAEGLLPLHNMGEPAAMYSWIFLLIAAVGPGAFALDTLRRRRR
ncbi:DoxX family protein [Amycolatopsis sp. NPDC059027]|uniref:DoxX family protein n=1 Tax=unclassified Amycolatopsis TaxID=2618356 RepID=UPI00366C9D2D